MLMIPPGGAPAGPSNAQALVVASSSDQEQSFPIVGSAESDTLSLTQGQDVTPISAPEAMGATDRGAPSRANMESVITAKMGLEDDGADEPVGPIAFVPKMVAEAYASAQSDPYSSIPTYQ